MFTMSLRLHKKEVRLQNDFEKKLEDIEERHKRMGREERMVVVSA